MHIYSVHIYLSFICEYFTDKSFKLHGICQAHGGEMLENWWVALIKRAWLVVNSDCQCWQALRGVVEGGGGRRVSGLHVCVVTVTGNSQKCGQVCDARRGKKATHNCLTHSQLCSERAMENILPKTKCDMWYNVFPFPTFSPFLSLSLFFSLSFLYCLSFMERNKSGKQRAASLLWLSRQLDLN